MVNQLVVQGVGVRPRAVVRRCRCVHSVLSTAVRPPVSIAVVVAAVTLPSACGDGESVGGESRRGALVSEPATTSPPTESAPITPVAPVPLPATTTEVAPADARPVPNRGRGRLAAYDIVSGHALWVANPEFSGLVIRGVDGTELEVYGTVDPQPCAFETSRLFFDRATGAQRPPEPLPAMDGFYDEVLTDTTRYEWVYDGPAYTSYLRAVDLATGAVRWQIDGTGTQAPRSATRPTRR